MAIFGPDYSVAAVKNVQLVSGQDSALVLEQPADGIVHNMSSYMCVDGRKRIIHKHTASVKVYGAGDVHSLLLASRNGDATFTNL